MHKLGSACTLRRAEAEFDMESARAFYAGKRVLITGAAGSVGSALAVQLAQLGCARLALLDHFDHGLLEIVERVRRINPKIETIEALCDIRDRERLDVWMGRIQPDVVIHAAALKHVHVGERHPAECVLTNLVGVRNTLVSAVEAGAKHFTLVSTDKAASPVCVMGATKRLAELLLLGYQWETAAPIQLKAVRFGNVFGSQGSVAPRFAAQIDEGGPLEVTHPDMERFFMSAREAVGLILSVTAHDDGERFGAYFMEMGEAVSIMELGRKMIAESGKDVEIVITGLRAGEKLKEELYDEYETTSASALPNIYRFAPLSADAYMTSADVAHLETIARSVNESIVRQRVFAHLDERLGRLDAAIG